MLYVAACTDKPNSLPTRLDNRPAHLEFLKGLGAKVKAAGALLTPDQTTPIGSLLIFEGESVAEIEALLANDPYAKAGLFSSVTVTPWRQAVGAPLA